MKRFASILLALLMLAVLPVTAMAGGNEYYEEGILVHNPDELEEALVEPGDDVLIASDFDWSIGDKVLIIDKYGNEKTDYGRDIPDIKIMGDWTIPADWTVICYETLYISSEAYMCTITVDGNFEFMANGSFSGQSYYDHHLVINGRLATSPDGNGNLSDFKETVINGTFESLSSWCSMGVVNVGSGAVVTAKNRISFNGLILADGVKLNADISLYGDITANGSAVFDGTVQVFEDSTFSGSLNFVKVQIASSTTTDNTVITIPGGSQVYIGDLIYVDGHEINVAGELTLGGKYHSFENSVIRLDGGVLNMEPWIQFSGEDENSSITGSGTLNLYAEYNSDFDTYNGYPRLFGKDADDGISEFVGSGITVWCNWSDCSHTWSEQGTVVEPDCSNQGYTLRKCTVCGTEKKTDYVEPTGKHTLGYALNQYSSNVIDVTCTGCGIVNRVHIIAEPPQVEFAGEPVQVAFVYCDGELLAPDDLPEIVYTDNDKIGTATASIELNGITISCTFEIVGCVHTVGTPASCQAPAVCGKCGESYGEVGRHTWSDTISRNDTNHYYECTACGAASSEEEMHSILPPELLEAFYIYWETHYVEDLSILEHMYVDDAAEAAGDCLICGIASAAVPGDTDGNGVVDDADVAQLLWYTLFPDAYTVSGDADINGDGKVDDADVAYLLWHTLFPEAYPLN
ncbi:MAG: dockerin type I repeat-containing protein [Oscillospiraceae bacterium]|nr:dockerin type I repeat-containing protein [Oscillospiraceae bacterium]